MSHEGVACGVVQTAPQPPQLSRAVRSTSQPFAGSPSQSSHPDSHAAMPQLPALHTPIACSGAQARPQAPQLASESLTGVSQPFVSSPSQSPKPTSQAATTQFRLTQAHDALPPPHGEPQAPQCAVEVAMFTQELPQIVFGGSHRSTHVPRLESQSSPELHVRPQPLQSATVPSIVSQSGDVPSQSAQSLSQTYWHSPATQLRAACSAPQLVTQSPQ